MFYLTEVEDHIRVEPKLFGLPTSEAVDKQLRETYMDYYDKELGRVISVIDVLSVGEGVIIPGDGAAYYKSSFKLLTWKPEIQELVYGTISEITSFGAFIDLPDELKHRPEPGRGFFHGWTLRGPNPDPTSNMVCTLSCARTLNRNSYAELLR